MVKPRVFFKIDYKKDAENYWATAHSKFKWGHKWQMDSEIKAKIANKSWKQTRKFLYLYVGNIHKNGKMLKLVHRQFEEAWRLIEDEYFKRLEKFIKRPVFAKRFTAYLTTINRCPYSIKDNSFMLVSSNSTFSALRVCCHEIMHFHFHNYFWDRCRKELNDAQTHELKEALTMLLNEEFSDLIIVRDAGYPTHQKFREYLSSVWRKTRDFDEMVEKGITYLQKYN